MQEAVHCHHNYIARETHFGADGLLTRKGAVNAESGVMGIIIFLTPDGKSYVYHIGRILTDLYLVEGLK